MGTDAKGSAHQRLGFARLAGEGSTVKACFESRDKHSSEKGISFLGYCADAGPSPSLSSSAFLLHRTVPYQVTPVHVLSMTVAIPCE